MKSKLIILIILIVAIVVGYELLSWQHDLSAPTKQQLAWKEVKLGMFIHFGMTTFSGELGSVDDPDTFAPSDLSIDQWLDAAESMGAKYAVLTAQHIDGFLLWRSDAYDYGVKQSAWEGGRGDLVRDFVDACRRRGIKPGIYFNLTENRFLGVEYPGIVKGGMGSDAQKEYNNIAEKMVREICSNYGELFELWFDSGIIMPEDGGPDIASIIKKLQPDAMVMQGQSASTIRLSGGETGMVARPCWDAADRYYAVGAGVPGGKFYLPVECDSPIREKQWFWYKNTEYKLLHIDDLIYMYENSVKNNANLLLNANPDIRGRIPEKDMALYKEFGEYVRADVGAEDIPPVRNK